MFPSSAVQHLAYTNVKNVDFEHSVFKWVDMCAVSKQMETSNVFRKETPVLNEGVLKGGSRSCFTENKTIISHTFRGQVA